MVHGQSLRVCGKASVKFCYVSVLCSHAHKAAVTSVKWNQNGNWLLTSSRDHLIKLFDIRTMKELEVLKGHKSDVNSKFLQLWLLSNPTLLRGALLCWIHFFCLSATSLHLSVSL